LEFLARPFEETTLFEIASAFESITRRRRPPPAFGELVDNGRF
jgi:Asp-tRNA(Asn)/Glu-tRNA(Gln) amidotransferase A subunit family amidase